MTKELLTVSMFAAAFALGATEYVSPNVIGRCDITKSTDLAKIIVPVPFLNFDADPTKPGQIKVADLIQVSTLSAGDKIYKIDDGKYLCWELNEGKTEWTPVEAKGVGGASGSSPGEATAAFLARGDGFWLETAATSVVLLGQTASTDTVEVSLAQGWNLVGVSGVNDVDLKDITPAEGDKIIFSDRTKIEATTDPSPSVWAKRDEPTFVPSSFKLTAGTGFWYYNAGAAKTITL